MKRSPISNNKNKPASVAGFFILKVPQLPQMEFHLYSSFFFAKTAP